VDKVVINSDFIDDLGVDHSDVPALYALFGEEFGITIPNNEAEKMHTPGDVIQYLIRIGVCPRGTLCLFTCSVRLGFRPGTMAAKKLTRA
jgi:acyl carrier protein